MSIRRGESLRCGIILAGGDGLRLKPFIRTLWGVDIPKQYTSFTGSRSLLEHTIDRAENLVSPECLFTVIARHHLQHSEVCRQIRFRPSGRVIFQPMNRETGPGIMLALAHLVSHYPNSTVALYPADHFILQEDLFVEYMRQAFEAVEAFPSKIVFLGADASEAKAEYGYILPEDPEPYSGFPMKRVKAFVERPTHQIARQVIGLGAMWNTMAMCFKPEVLMQLIALAVPDLHRWYQRISKILKTSRESLGLEKIYRDMTSMEFSGDLLGRLEIHSRNQLFALPMKGIIWSDWDSADRILSVTQSFASPGLLTDELQPRDIGIPLPLAQGAA